jgi:hypothetical protein
LPSWVPDISNSLFTGLRGINIDTWKEASPDLSSTEFDLDEDSFQTSKFRITWQNELLVSAHIWDTVSEVAHPGLNDVGADLENLSRWSDLVSKLDLPRKKRQQVLWRTLIEDTTATSINVALPKGLDDSKFLWWLVFHCIISALGHWKNLHLPTPVYSVTMGFNRPRANILEMISKTQSIFEILGIPSLPAYELNWWKDPPTDDLPKCHGYLTAMMRRASIYGPVVGSKDPSRRLLRSEASLGTGPREVQAGDAICIIDGANIPYVLRPTTTNGKFQLVGEAYLYGVDTKELLRKAQAEGSFKSLCIV